MSFRSIRKPTSRKRNPYDQAGTSGFTLIELMIAMVILTFISVGIYQATTRTFDLKVTLGSRGEFYNEIRLAMGILDRDLTHIFTPKMLFPGIKKATDPQELDSMMRGERGQSAYWGKMIDGNGVRPSIFLGKEKSMSFVSSSHYRVYKDSLESIFLKVAYELQSDTLPGALTPGLQALMKTENTNAFAMDGDDAKQANTFPILRGVRQFKFRYYQIEKDKWYDSWDSSREDFKDRLPDVVEVSVEIVGERGVVFDGIYKIRPEVYVSALHPSY
jgi:prepilin-type N-terminal cleavage/methylation domain-containing protein